MATTATTREGGVLLTKTSIEWGNYQFQDSVVVIQIAGHLSDNLCLKLGKLHWTQ